MENQSDSEDDREVQIRGAIDPEDVINVQPAAGAGLGNVAGRRSAASSEDDEEFHDSPERNYRVEVLTAMAKTISESKQKTEAALKDLQRDHEAQLLNMQQEMQLQHKQLEARTMADKARKTLSFGMPEETPRSLKAPTETAKAEAPVEESPPSSKKPAAAAERVPMARMMTYDGKDSWLEYEAHFMEYCGLYDWTPTEKARYLCLHLRGAAQTILLGLTSEEKTSYEKVVDSLKRYFCPDEK